MPHHKISCNSIALVKYMIDSVTSKNGSHKNIKQKQVSLQLVPQLTERESGGCDTSTMARSLPR